MPRVLERFRGRLLSNTAARASSGFAVVEDTLRQLGDTQLGETQQPLSMTTAAATTREGSSSSSGGGGGGDSGQG